jgi:hypothetical protein
MLTAYELVKCMIICDMNACKVRRQLSLKKKDIVTAYHHDLNLPVLPLANYCEQ